MSEERYAPEVIDQLIELMADSDFAGITLMTHYFDSAKQLTHAIQERLNIPVIWGGFHPSVRQTVYFSRRLCGGWRCKRSDSTIV